MGKSDGLSPSGLGLEYLDCQNHVYSDMDPDPDLSARLPAPFTLDAPQPVVCPLGQIVYAGTKWGSQATYTHTASPGFFRPNPHFLLVLTLEGEADYVDRSGLRAVLRRGDLVWTPPGVDQSYGPRPGSRWSELFLWMSGPLFDTWHAHGFPGGRSRLMALMPCDTWIERFTAVVTERPDGRGDSPLLRLCRLQAMLAEALQCEAGRPAQGDSAWLDRACRLLRSGSLTSPALEAVARQTGVSYSLFRKRFLQLTGKTPGQYRCEEVIRRACRLLARDDATVGGIAQQLGFHDPFHFSRRFRQVMGMSPRAFQRSR
ncbi:MAG: helix-turn-helix transcriptional regulator [Caulobacterales bacterium]|nr:helix-turn-helix transcriptional regulator [Caulobacterales bacterium]